MLCLRLRAEIDSKVKQQRLGFSWLIGIAKGLASGEYHASAVLSIISNSSGNTSNSGLSADQAFDLV